MKKFLSIALAFAMLLSFALVASAEETTAPYTITIDNSTSGYTYAAYQIFSGDVATLDGKTVLTNIQWGSGVNCSDTDFQTKVLNALGATLDEDEGETFTAEFVASKLTDTNAAAFAKAVASYLSTDATATFIYNETEKNYKATVAGGYYLIQNTEDGVPDDGAYTAYILKVTDNVTAKPKTGVPTIEKKVKDRADDSGQTSNWQDSADHDIGDTIWYKVTVTIPAGTLQNFDSYSLTITDTLSEGLTYTGGAPSGGNDNSNLKLYVWNKSHDVQNEYNFGVTAFESKLEGNETVLTLTTQDIVAQKREYPNANLDWTAEIVVTWEYTCRLNEKATIGSVGNPNDVVLTYRNNPNSEGTGTTLKDTAIVFTYQADVKKVDQDGKDLTGADFTLYKAVDATVEGAMTVDQIKAELGSKYDWNCFFSFDTYVKVGNGIGIKSVDGSGTVFSFKGLDDGYYVLVETTVPDGYNAWDAQAFHIVAEHDEIGNPAELTKLVSGDLFSGTVSTGILSATIENKIGATLPSTGGMGTTIFYVFGTVLVLGAGILLIAKKRVAR